VSGMTTVVGSSTVSVTRPSSPWGPRRAHPRAGGLTDVHFGAVDECGSVNRHKHFL
jgi:hypothetical protein